MKNYNQTLKTIGILLLSIVSINSFGQTVNLKGLGNKSFGLWMNNQTNTAQIKIKDNLGDIVFQDETENSEYGKLFNMNTMIPGQYQVELSDEGQIRKLNLKVKI